MNSIPSKDLIAEHGAISLMLKIMDNVARRLEKGEPVEKSHLEKIAEFLQVFGDQCHHFKEESALFPALSKAAAQKNIYINELLGQHIAGRDLVGGITKTLFNYEPSNPEAFHVAANFYAYTRLLHQHIESENKVLIPLVDSVFSKVQLEEIEGEFQTIENNVIGSGKHEKYHRMLDELTALYY